jgi:hypothetical protein
LGIIVVRAFLVSSYLLISMGFKSILSALTAARSFIISGKSNELKEKELDLIKRQQNAIHLKKYSDNLIEQKRRTDPIIDELAKVCRHVLGRIADRTDRYSQKDSYRSDTATRHLFYEIVRNLFNAFSYEMPWQTTENLYLSRFRVIVNLQYDYEGFSTKQKRIDFENLYKKGQCSNLECQLFNTKYFVELLTEFFDRIADHEELYQSILIEIEPVFAFISKHRDTLKNEVSAIKALKGDNRLEEFKIEDSYDLHNAYKLFERKLAFVEQSCLIEYWAKCTTPENRLSQILIIGFLLIMIDGHQSWGQHIAL